MHMQLSITKNSTEKNTLKKSIDKSKWNSIKCPGGKNKQRYINKKNRKEIKWQT